MDKLSVIVPARNEPDVARTVAGLCERAAGDIEVLVVLDGYWPIPAIADDKRVRVIHVGKPRGMRPAINLAAGIARGRYLMKIDAHCLVAEGYDAVLKADCPDAGIVVPRRFALDKSSWSIEQRSDTKYPVDYEYLTYPDASDPDTFRNVVWLARRDARADVLVDDLLVWQGSAWLMSRRHWDSLGGLDDRTFGPTAYREAHELSLKTWYGGGTVQVTKRTWYAHWHKPSDQGRGYPVPDGERDRVCRLMADWAQAGDRRDRLADLIARFEPVPTWPAQRTAAA
jgi:glycosyltransferase involved in cell wall biosynthesis